MGDRYTTSRVIVLDTSSVINGYFPTASPPHYATPGVIQECKGLRASASIAAALDLGYLKIAEPDSQSRAQVAEAMHRIGAEISETDAEVLALALTLRRQGKVPTILTDDYGLQNLAHTLQIRYSSVYTRGIRTIYTWRSVCEGCGREFTEHRKICPVCGGRVKRVLVRKAIGPTHGSPDRY